MTDRDRAYLLKEAQRTLDESDATAAFCLCQRWILKDTIALLKEQEAVAPIPPTDESDLWKCGNCNHQLFRCTHQMYCEMCGRSVKWND